jgi:chemotaxis protein CheD
MSEEIFPVGLGELKSGMSSGQILVCYGLGSCIGLAVYDHCTRIGAMVHVVLPDSSLNRGLVAPPGKFADTGVPAVIEAVIKLGGTRNRLQARAAGGARMLNVVGAGTRLDIGARNIEAVRAALHRAGVPLLAEDTGGGHGRTVQLHIGTGRMVVSTVGQGKHEL